jgi:hypothetical protein
VPSAIEIYYVEMTPPCTEGTQLSGDIAIQHQLTLREDKLWGNNRD